ncbi:MAG: hypothetical protein JXA54_11315 [Candidatus Heimdallarchaeota archaeon]|nr:hypothetical protein [Candidatus Heimdallarchaeota archaeon]
MQISVTKAVNLDDIATDVDITEGDLKIAGNTVIDENRYLYPSNYINPDGELIVKWNTATNRTFTIQNQGGNCNLNIDPSGSNQGNIKINGTTFIDKDLALQNISTITNSGTIDCNSTIDAASGFNVDGSTVINSSKDLTNIASITASGNINTTAGAVQINGTDIINYQGYVLNAGALGKIGRRLGYEATEGSTSFDTDQTQSIKTCYYIAGNNLKPYSIALVAMCKHSTAAAGYIKLKVDGDTIGTITTATSTYACGTIDGVLSATHQTIGIHTVTVTINEGNHAGTVYVKETEIILF